MDVIMTERDAVPAPTLTCFAKRGLSRPVWLVAAAAFAVEMAVSGRYGYVRDELYFLAAGHHVAPGYVDQPALTPLLARLDAALTGNTLVGLRALPALGMAALVLLTAAMARALGASRRGQFLAALATACCAEYLGAMHELTTTAPDFVCWAATLLFAVRLLASGNPRWWVAIGGCAGVGMAAKWNVAFLVAALLAGMACTSAVRPLLRSRWLLAGAALFTALAAPDFVWQAAHGWAAFDVFANLQRDAWQNRLLYWPSQVAYTSILLVPLWVLGARWALRDSRQRAIGIAAVAVIVAQFVLGGKAYYPGGAYMFLFAAGAVYLDSRVSSDSRLPSGSAVSSVSRLSAGSRLSSGSAVSLDGSSRLAGKGLRVRAAWYCVAAAISLPISLPVLPAAALAKVPVQTINYDLGEEIGWQSEVGLVARVYHSLPASQRSVATVIAGNYGEAGALERYGPARGLPRAYSGDNNFWLWGPPPSGDTVAVVVSVPPSVLHRYFAHVREVAMFRNGLGVSDDEEGTPIYVATGLRAPWTRAWPAFRDYA